MRIDIITRDALLRALSAPTVDEAAALLGWSPQTSTARHRHKLRQLCERHGVANPFARVFKTYTREQLERAFATHNNGWDAAISCGVPMAKDGCPIIHAIKQAARNHGIPWPYTVLVGRRIYRPDAPEARGLAKPQRGRR